MSLLKEQTIEDAAPGVRVDAPCTDAGRADWLQMFESDAQAVVDQHPDLMRSPFAMRFGRQRTHAFVVDGQTRALATMGAYRHRVQVLPGVSKLAVSLRGLKLIGNRLLGDNGEAAAADFLAAMDQWLMAGAADCVLIEEMETESPLWRLLHDGAQRMRARVIYPQEPQKHWVIDLPPTIDQWWAKFSSRTRSNLKSKLKAPGLLTRAYTDAGEVEQFLTKAQAVSVRSWQSNRSGRLRVQASAEQLAYWQAVARMGAFRCYLTEKDGQPIAFEVGMQWNGRYMAEETGYDPAFGGLSPGTVVFLETMKDLYARNAPAVVDFGFGHVDYKQTYGTRYTYSGPVLLMRRSIKPAVLIAVDTLRRQATNAGRTLLRVSGLLDAARRFYRR